MIQLLTVTILSPTVSLSSRSATLPGLIQLTVLLLSIKIPNSERKYIWVKRYSAENLISLLHVVVLLIELIDLV